MRNVNYVIDKVYNMKKILNPWTGVDGYMCFGCAHGNLSGVKMDFYADGSDVISVWKPEARFQGWLHTLHGGIQAVLLDEICGWLTISQCQTVGVTSKMETRYSKPISTDEPYLIIRARLKERRRNILLIEAEIYNRTNEICSSAICTYFTLPPEKAKLEMNFTEVKLSSEEISLEELIRPLTV